MKLLSQIPKDELKDMTVLLRTGLNTPLDESGAIVDASRIHSALPTIEYLAAHAKRVIILSHIGRERDASLTPVARGLQEYLPELRFAKWADGPSDYKVVLMENLRQDSRETSTNEADRKAFAKEIVDAVGADIFVQDAFAVTHREHASITTMPKFLPGYAGLLLEREVEHLSKALNPEHPSLFILGGAKFATKEPLIRKFLDTYDRIFIGGAIANEFFKARGYEVGRSLVHDGKIPHDILYNDKIILPEVVRAADTDGHTVYVSPQDVTPDMRIVDAVPPSDLLYDALLGKPVKFVLWNGPLGYYEGGFSQGTDTLLQMFDGSYKKDGTQLVTGGGDTLATVGQEYRDIFTHISSGGGALLTFLQEGELPGVKALG